MALLGFPYSDFSPLNVPEDNFLGRFTLPSVSGGKEEAAVIEGALSSPLGTPSLRKLAEGKKRILIVSDDHHRPTPVRRILPRILEALGEIPDDRIEIIMALGSHRPMTADEIAEKIGEEAVKRFRVFNHDWTDPRAMTYQATVEPGIEVWINRKVEEADVVLGVGRIMPLDVCGFTGGGKILIPGLCGEKTNGDMHWIRTTIPAEEVIGKRDNPIRSAIDAASLAAGLSAIFDVILDGSGRIVDAVFGHPVDAHRRGCEIAARVHTTVLPRKADIVITDGYPFDQEFWQANKALDNAGLVVKKGGVIILVSPCREGLSRTHEEAILRYGYRSSAEIRKLAGEGAFRHRVAAVHMLQVAEATVDKGVRCIFVTPGIPREKIERVGFHHAPDAEAALRHAFRLTGPGASVIALHRASEMLPVIG